MVGRIATLLGQEVAESASLLRLGSGSSHLEAEEEKRQAEQIRRLETQACRRG